MVYKIYKSLFRETSKEVQNKKNENFQLITFITILEVNNHIIHIYTDNLATSKQLNEAKSKGKTLLTGTYSATKHAAHTPKDQTHLHVYAKNNQIFALNKDGSAHDASHKVRIPNEVADAIRIVFPKWKIPKDNFIECDDSISSEFSRKKIFG
jgi:hypothetical protein